MIGAEDQKYYSPKEIADFADITDLLGHYKSPAHWIGRTLKLYKFQTNRSGGKRKYFLSKKTVQKIVDIYSGTDVTTPNDTNNTQKHKQHKTTQKGVPFRAISVITPETIPEEKNEVIEEEIIG